LFRCGCCCHDIVCCQQDALIIIQPWKQPVWPRMLIDPVLTGQRYRVTLQLLDAEQLRAKQLGIMVVAQRIPGACQKPDFFDDYEILLERIRGG
jgi:hypothetical protein